MGVVDSVQYGRVLVVRLAGAGANALSREMAGQLQDCLCMAGERPDIGAVLITGAFGGAFCGGSDIRELIKLREDGEGPGPLLKAEARAFETLAAMNKPTIAAIEGASVGGGLELALCCDLIVAAEDAEIGLPEIKIGVFAALGGTVRLQRRIGEGRARELLLLGDPVSGTTAREWGLVNRAVPERDVYRTARALADRLAGGPMTAMAGVKQSLRDADQLNEADSLAAALERAMEHAGSDEVTEGFRAFDAKEDADFSKLSSTVDANVMPLHMQGRGRKTTQRT